MHMGTDPYHYNKMPNRNRGRRIGKEGVERRKGQGRERAGNYVRPTHTATNTGLGTNFTHERKTKPADRQASLAILMCQCKPALCPRTKFSLNIHNLL